MVKALDSGMNAGGRTSYPGGTKDFIADMILQTILASKEGLQSLAMMLATFTSKKNYTYISVEHIRI